MRYLVYIAVLISAMTSNVFAAGENMNNQEEPLYSFMLDLDGEYVSYSIKINDVEVKSGSHPNGSFMLNIPINKYLKTGQNILQVSAESENDAGIVNVKLYDHGDEEGGVIIEKSITANQAMSAKLNVPEDMTLEKQTSIFDM